MPPVRYPIAHRAGYNCTWSWRSAAYRRPGYRRPSKYIFVCATIYSPVITTPSCSASVVVSAQRSTPSAGHAVRSRTEDGSTGYSARTGQPVADHFPSEKIASWTALLEPEVRSRLRPLAEAVPDPRPYALLTSAFGCLDAALATWVAGDATADLSVIARTALNSLS